MTHRIGVDIGGTFTDFVLTDSEGLVRLAKVRSNHADPTRALHEGLTRLAQSAGFGSPHDLLAATDLVVHGTTVGLNALIQNTGARTALFATKGFHDSIEIRLGHKDQRYDFGLQPPPVLVPRDLRFEVQERVASDGRVHMPLCEDSVREHARRCREEDVEAIAVSYLWSFLNPAHEIRTRQIIEEEYPGVFISLSSEVWPQIREYDRTSTTVINSFIGPIVTAYVTAIESLLTELGYAGHVRYVRSNGGLASPEIFRTKPVFGLNSGPAAGPAAATSFANHAGSDHVLLVDMGGTSFDVCLVDNGLPTVVKNLDFHRYRVAVPMIDVHTIGAGGGSIAWLDPTGMLRVGPHSAQADPGPASYGRGGTRPTVTDANVVLGYLNRKALLKGRVPIDQDAARSAICQDLAEPLGLPLEEAAYGVFSLVTREMAAAISVVSIERGHDPRDYVLVVGGGAGAIHAAYLADDLDIATVIVPKVASTLCAFGAVVADVRHDFGCSYLARWERLNVTAIDGKLRELEQWGRGELGREGVASDRVRIERTFDIRYVGQIFEVSVPVPDGTIGPNELSSIAKTFHERHEALYGYTEPGDDIELMNMNVSAIGEMPASDFRIPMARDGRPRVLERRSVWIGGQGYHDLSILDGESFPTGSEVVGPSIIEEPTTSILIPGGWQASLEPPGMYVLTRR